MKGRQKDELLKQLGLGVVAILISALGWNISRAVNSIDDEIKEVKTAISDLHTKERIGYERLGRIETEIQYIRANK